MAKRLVRETQSFGLRRATRRKQRIHGGIKARENNVEESAILGMLSLLWGNPEANATLLIGMA
jgi:hypothetical protein